MSTISAGTTSTTTLIHSGDTTGSLVLKTNDTGSGGTTAVTIDTSQNVGIGTTAPKMKLNAEGTYGNPVTSGATPTGIARLSQTTNNVTLDFGVTTGNRVWMQGADKADLSFTYDVVINPNGGNVGIGTSSPRAKLSVTNGTENTSGDAPQETIITGANQTITSGLGILTVQSNTAIGADVGATIALGGRIRSTGTTTDASNFAVVKGAKENATSDNSAGYFAISTKPNGVAPVERMRIESSGNLLVGTTDTVVNSGAGIVLFPTQGIAIGKTNSDTIGACIYMNRATVGDGGLIEFAESGTIEGTITISGTTVSYNGGNLSRWAQMLTKPDLLKGTVMSNLDEMNEYVDADGNPVPNEQLNKVKVSDIEGDANVAGVFVNWTHDEAHNVDEINMAMTGDMIIRIAQGTTVQRGDLLMSAGDGTAKPQGDDIVRSKTVAKVTSTHVTCTYADGSFCVPCVLMAC